MRDIDYASQMAKRLGAKSTSARLTESVIGACRALFSGAETLTMYDLPLDKLILGDSHSVAYSMPDQIIGRNNGKTLYSAIIKDPNWVVDKVKSVGKNIEHLTLCLGSIDIRFHAIRDGRPDAIRWIENYINPKLDYSHLCMDTAWSSHTIKDHPYGRQKAMLELGLVETFNGAGHPSDDKILKEANMTVEEYQNAVNSRI